MIDTKIESRAQKYQKIGINIRNEREIHSLRLRKEKLFDFLLEKRLQQNHSGSSSPDLKASSKLKTPEDINIQEQDKILFDESTDDQKVILLHKWLNGDSVEYKHFAVHKINCAHIFSASSPEIRKKMHDPSMVYPLMNELLNSRDQFILNDLSSIFIRLTYQSEKICEDLIEVDTLNNLFDITFHQSESITFIENMCTIFGNLLTSNKKHILSTTTYLSIIMDFFLQLDAANVQSINLPHVIFWNLNLITVDMSNDEKRFALPIVSTLLSYIAKPCVKLFNTKDLEELLQYLKLLLELSGNDEVLCEMIEYNFMACLIGLFDFLYLGKDKTSQVQGHMDVKDVIVLPSKLVVIVLKIMGNIFSLSDDILIKYQLMNLDLLEIFEELTKRYRYHKHDTIEVALDLIWTLSNVMAGPKEFSDMIFDSQIIIETIFMYYTNDHQLLYQCLFLIANALEKSSDEGIIKLLKLNAIRIICNTLNMVDDSKMLMQCLRSVDQLLLFAEKLPESYMILKEFENCSIHTRLEQLSIHNNEEISANARKCLQCVEKCEMMSSLMK